jgi:hypothetical protein
LLAARHDWVGEESVEHDEQREDTRDEQAHGEQAARVAREA